ncbi:hypothetical protein C8Q76DRAFT_686341 [Earliella scabrosa]|nr:hypothetical protein C8Q76DRAFT_686341 [Earliella scabrosa]
MSSVHRDATTGDTGNELTGAFEGRVSHYCMFASAALLSFDIALTFSMEVERIWKRNFTGATLIFLVLRYASALGCLLWCVVEFAGQEKIGILIIHVVCTTLVHLSSALVTVFRVYGVSLRDRRALIIVIPLASVSPAVYLASYSVPSSVYNGLSTKTYRYMFDVAPVVCDTAANLFLVGLTWHKTFSIKWDAYRGGVTVPLSTLLAKDGSIFFLLLIGNILMRYASNTQGNILVIVWSCFHHVFTDIILCRFMLNLRGIYLSDGGLGQGTRPWEESMAGTSVAFRRFPKISSVIVGNLAATTRTFSWTADDWEEHSGDLVATPNGAACPEECDMDTSRSSTSDSSVVRYSDDPYLEGMMEE